MAFTRKTWVDVPDESNPPAGAVQTSAGEFNRIEVGVADAHAHLGAALLAHGGTVVYVEASTVPPANPPTGLLWYQTDGVKRLLQNEGAPAAPVWLDVTRDKLVASDLVTDYVVSGLLPAVPSPKSLSASVPAGQAYTMGRRVTKAAATIGFAASRDTYTDLDRDGVYRLSAIAGGAVAPAVYANSIRLFKVVTDASVAQVMTVTVATVVNSTIYTVRINGVDVSFTSDATATAGEIALGLVAAINASTDPNVTPVTAATAALAADATATLTITADVAGTPFTGSASANLTIASTTANNTAGITGVSDLRTLNPTVRGVGGGHTIQDEGATLAARTNLNFVGPGVAVTDDSVNNRTSVAVEPKAVGSFHAYAAVNQVDIPHATFTKANFGTEEFDFSGWFDPALSRFTPQKAGAYNLQTAVRLTDTVANKELYVLLYKNGARFIDLAQLHSSVAGAFFGGGNSVDVQANGTTDYFEVFVWHSFGTNAPDLLGGSTYHITWFSGHYVGALA